MNDPQPWWLTMPVAEVAATILPYFSSRARVSELIAMKEIVTWLGAAPRSRWSWDPFEDPDFRGVAEAMQVLEHAGLLMRSVAFDTDRGNVGLTRLGMHALATNTVRQHLGLGDATPLPNPGGGGT